MIDLLQERLRQYHTSHERYAYLREYLQELILKIIEKSTSMAQLAFVGGTALRILYKLPRFSEDLDFSQVETSFDFLDLLHFIKRELGLYGFSVGVTQKSENTVKSSFIKFEGLLHRLNLSPHANQILSIKLEVDTNPPSGYLLQTSVINNAFFLQIQHFDQSSLFAGKCHALLCRPYPKGRDYFDLLWFMGNRIVPNYTFLSNAYAQTQKDEVVFEHEILKQRLIDRVCSVDFLKVISDVEPFLIEKDTLRYFSSGSFVALLESWQPLEGNG